MRSSTAISQDLISVLQGVDLPNIAPGMTELRLPSCAETCLSDIGLSAHQRLKLTPALSRISQWFTNLCGCEVGIRIEVRIAPHGHTALKIWGNCTYLGEIHHHTRQEELRSALALFDTLMGDAECSSSSRALSEYTIVHTEPAEESFDNAECDQTLITARDDAQAAKIFIALKMGLRKRPFSVSDVQQSIRQVYIACPRTSWDSWSK